MEMVYLSTFMNDAKNHLKEYKVIYSFNNSFVSTQEAAMLKLRNDLSVVYMALQR